MAWLSGWSKRKKITLTGGSDGAQTDYQIKLTITYDSDMQVDFDDLRFTKANGTELINAWLESKIDSTSAIIWVEFPTTPANTVTEDYYMYYGNNSAVSNWDIGSTFVFGDDFHRSNSGTVGNGWTDSGDASIESNKLKIISAAGIDRAFTINSSYMFECKGVVDSGSNGELLLMINGNEINQLFGITIRPPTTVNGFRRLASGLAWSPIGTAAYSTDYSLRILWDESAGNSSCWYNDGSWNVAWSTLTGYSSSTTNKISIIGNAAQVSYIYYIHVRKYTTNPASYGFGGEESEPITGNPYWYYNLLKRRN